MSLINTKVRPFVNQAWKNGKFIQISNQDIEKKWSIFFFYPADFTFVCPTELGDLADHYTEFKNIGVEIYSISTDTHFSHKIWHDSSLTISKISYAMISDPTRNLTKNFDNLCEESGLAYRGTFIIDPNTMIRSIEIVDSNIGRNVYYLLEKVKSLQYVFLHTNEVCPARWKEDQDTIIPDQNLIGKI